MKYLLWLIVGLFVWWAWKRATLGRSRPAAPPEQPSPQNMVTCLHCGVHLPQSEAVAGTLGLYCSAAHRSSAGDRNPG
ncbi:MAG: hypothetical protein FJY36_01550 [Betaproteobacteria bacterium]|nr:hypothetical protein [Betaproteobacteria bacterium]